MSRKNKLLSIGEVSKMTGASIRSLRYYEQIKILEPAFIDPDSSYRYYAMHQIYFIEIILFCIELDIPLKELAGFINQGNVLDYEAILNLGKEIAFKKSQTIARGLEFIHEIEQQIALSETHQDGELYERKLAEKFFYTLPYDRPFEDLDQFEVAKAFLDMPDYYDDGSGKLFEYGFLCEYTPEGQKCYAFTELPEHTGDRHVKTIPAGTYFCKQHRDCPIDEAHTLFEEQLAESASFLAIQTELLTSKYKINSPPTNELRVITL